MAHEAAQAGFTHHAMAGDDDGYRVCTAGLADSLRAGFQFSRQFSIAARLTARYVEHGLPDFLLVRSSACFKRHGKLHVWIFKVTQQLFAYSYRERTFRALRLFARRQKINARQHILCAEYAEHPERNS